MTSRGDGRAFLGALAFYAACFGAFFYQSLVTGELIAPSDALDFGVAGYLSTPSVWTDGLYSGYPIAADPQSLIFYPLLEVFRRLNLGWNLFMVAPFVVASAAAFLLARRLTGSTVAAVFSGFAFGFSGPMLGNMGHFNQLHAVAWAPLVLYGLQRVREGESRSGAAVTAVAFALMWLAGHPQLPVYVSYLALALLLGGLVIDRPSGTQAVQRVAWSGVGMALGIGLAAVLLVPMLELSSFSPRAESNWELYTAKAVPPWQLLTLVLPFSFGFWADNDLSVPYFGDGSAGENLAYVGLLPLALALGTPWLVRTGRRDARLWVALAVVAGLLALCAATPLGTLFYYAPGYARFRMPSRHLFLFALCVSMAAGFALRELIQQRHARAFALAVVALVAVGLSAFGVFASTTPSVRALLRDAPLYAQWTLGWPLGIAVTASLVGLAVLRRASIRAVAPLAGGLLTVLLLVDLGAVHYRVPGAHFEYADVVPSDAAPKPRIEALRDELLRTGERVIAVDGTHNPFLLPNLTRPWGVRAAGGSGPLAMQRYVDMMRMGSPGDVPVETLLSPHLALDLLGIRYALVPDTTSIGADLLRQPERWSAIDTLQYDPEDPDSRYTLFRNAQTHPRAWCVGTVERTDAEAQLSALRTGQLPDQRPFTPATAVMAETDQLPQWQQTGPAEVARSVALSTGRHEYRVDSPTPCVLVVSEVFYPWWQASVDTVSLRPSRVNYTMVGVPVPAGQHVVRLWMRPVSLWAGASVTGICALAWLVLAGAALRRP